VKDDLKKSSKTNILVLESKFGRGGIEALIYSIVKRPRKDKYNAILCTLYDPGPIEKEFLRDGYTVHHDYIRSKFNLNALFKLRRMITESRIGAVLLAMQPPLFSFGLLQLKTVAYPDSLFHGGYSCHILRSDRRL
jgi:hypothetical protein